LKKKKQRKKEKEKEKEKKRRKTTSAVSAKSKKKALSKLRKPSKVASASKKETEEEEVYDLWGHSQEAISKEVKRSKRYRLNTVVEPAGCSYNPRYDDHQDVVAEIVAEDVQKKLLESANKSIKLVEAGDGSKSKGSQRLKKPHEVSDQKFVSVKKTLKEIRKEERLRDGKIQRKKEEEAERRKVLPPRLGKKRFQPESNKVLTTDEIDGSIRTLRSAPLLAGSVFNKLQRKGLIEPRDQAIKRRRRRYVRA